MINDIVIMNVAGLISKESTLRTVLPRLNPTVLAVTETHLTVKHDEKLYNLSDIGYCDINVFSHSNRTGGVTIYLKKQLHYEIIMDEADKSMWCLIIKIKNLNKKIMMGAFYRSPIVRRKEYRVKNWASGCNYWTNIKKIM